RNGVAARGTGPRPGFHHARAPAGRPGPLTGIARRPRGAAGTGRGPAGGFARAGTSPIAACTADGDRRDGERSRGTGTVFRTATNFPRRPPYWVACGADWMAHVTNPPQTRKIGRASCRERV